MAGVDDQAIERAQPVLEVFSVRLARVGPRSL
jgi:3-hydroxyisobutyrate dehydrogenase-like beta-hydroxyacid dehydrogenase